jgi:hypothetical protein
VERGGGKVSLAKKQPRTGPALLLRSQRHCYSISKPFVIEEVQGAIANAGVIEGVPEAALAVEVQDVLQMPVVLDAFALGRPKS